MEIDPRIRLPFHDPDEVEEAYAGAAEPDPGALDAALVAAAVLGEEGVEVVEEAHALGIARRAGARQRGPVDTGALPPGRFSRGGRLHGARVASRVSRRRARG